MAILAMISVAFENAVSEAEKHGPGDSPIEDSRPLRPAHGCAAGRAPEAVSDGERPVIRRLEVWLCCASLLSEFLRFRSMRIVSSEPATDHSRTRHGNAIFRPAAFTTKGDWGKPDRQSRPLDGGGARRAYPGVEDFSAESARGAGVACFRLGCGLRRPMVDPPFWQRTRCDSDCR